MCPALPARTGTADGVDAFTRATRTSPGCALRRLPSTEADGAAAVGLPESILLLGPPGSGKGTQARLLEQHQGYVALDWGAERRRAVAMGTPTGERIRALGDLVARGKFLDDALATEVMVEALRRTHRGGADGGDGADGVLSPAYVLDGFPRNIAQFRALTEAGATTRDAQHGGDGAAHLNIKAVVVLHAPFELLLRRVEGRLIHAASGRTYHPVECPPREAGLDDVTGEPLEPRLLSTNMTTREALQARCGIEAREIAPLVEYLEDKAAAHPGHSLDNASTPPNTVVIHADLGRPAAWFEEHRRSPMQLHDDIVRELGVHGILTPVAHASRASNRLARRAYSCRALDGTAATAMMHCARQTRTSHRGCAVARSAHSSSANAPVSAPEPAKRRPPLRRVGIVGLGPHARRIYYVMLRELAAQRGEGDTNAELALRIPVIVDMEDQRDAVEGFLRTRGEAIWPDSRPELMFVPCEHRHDDAVFAPVQATLDRLLAAGQLDGLVVASEPSTHEPYLRWALANGVDVFVDKPPIIPRPFDGSGGTIASQFEDVLSLEETSDSAVAVCVQRRAHPGYRFVHRLVSDVVSRFRVPVSFVSLEHADGMWCMPGEMATRESHPYKYHYGKLMHSGYHFVDLLSSFQSINDSLLPERARADAVDVVARSFGARDLVHQVPPAELQELTGATAGDVQESMRLFKRATGGGGGGSDSAGDGSLSCASTPRGEVQLGELNVHALVTYLSDSHTGTTGAAASDADVSGGCRAVTCTGSLNLLQNSFSRRGWFHPRADGYKGNGRVRHERAVVTVGSLLSVHVTSYQSHEAGQPDLVSAESRTKARLASEELLSQVGLDAGALARASRTRLGEGGGTTAGGHRQGGAWRDEALSYGVGHEEHFDVTVYRNTAVIGGLPVETIPIGDIMRAQAAEGAPGLGARAVSANLAALGLHLGHNEFGRFELLRQWVAGEPSSSPLRAQRATMELLGRLYGALAAQGSAKQ